MDYTALWREWGYEPREESIETCCATDIVLAGPKNAEIQATIYKCYDHIRECYRKKILCAISGGYDSDIVLDLMVRCGGKEKTDFVFYDTGLEYDATKEHISYLEWRYGVKIRTVEPKKHIPTCVRDYGVPFWSKYVSDMMSRLQRHNFQWEDGSVEELLKKYPRCKAALRWWCNEWGDKSRFNISYTPGLKEFIQQFPTPMRISAMCCEKTKKDPAHALEDSRDYELAITGVRKLEGGKRSTTYKSCFDQDFSRLSRFRPIFWWGDREKEIYRKHYGIVRSDCYEVWGMARTGCAGCPFGKKFEDELKLVQIFEPKRYQAMLAVFGESYDYTRCFLEFREKMKINEKPEDKMQTRINGV